MLTLKMSSEKCIRSQGRGGNSDEERARAHTHAQADKFYLMKHKSRKLASFVCSGGGSAVKLLQPLICDRCGAGVHVRWLSLSFFFFPSFIVLGLGPLPTLRSHVCCREAMCWCGVGGCSTFKASSSSRAEEPSGPPLHLPPSVGNGWVRPTGEGESEKEVRLARERERDAI